MAGEDIGDEDSKGYGVGGGRWEKENVLQWKRIENIFIGDKASLVD